MVFWFIINFDVVQKLECGIFEEVSFIMLIEIDYVYVEVKY